MNEFSVLVHFSIYYLSWKIVLEYHGSREKSKGTLIHIIRGKEKTA